MPEVPPRLRGVKGSTLDEDVRRDRDRRRLGEDFADRPVDVGVRVRLLGRHRMGAEPRRDPTGVANRGELGHLGLAIEAVTALPLERRRAVRDHGVAMPCDERIERHLSRGTRGSRRREDASAGREKLVVRGASGAQRELVDAVAGKRRVRVAVDETGDRTEATAVEFFPRTGQRTEGGHRPHGHDAIAVKEDIRILDDLDAAEVLPRSGACPVIGVTTCARSRIRSCVIPDRRS